MGLLGPFFVGSTLPPLMPIVGMSTASLLFQALGERVNEILAVAISSTYLTPSWGRTGTGAGLVLGQGRDCGRAGTGSGTGEGLGLGWGMAGTVAGMVAPEIPLPGGSLRPHQQPSKGCINMVPPHTCLPRPFVEGPHYTVSSCQSQPLNLLFLSPSSLL